MQLVLKLILCYSYCTFALFQPSESAVDDYNRARAYLADIANRDGIPVLSDITEALACVLKQLQDQTVSMLLSDYEGWLKYDVWYGILQWWLKHSAVIWNAVQLPCDILMFTRFFQASSEMLL